MKCYCLLIASYSLNWGFHTFFIQIISMPDSPWIPQEITHDLINYCTLAHFFNGEVGIFCSFLGQVCHNNNTFTSYYNVEKWSAVIAKILYSLYIQTLAMQNSPSAHCAAWATCKIHVIYMCSYVICCITLIGIHWRLCAGTNYSVWLLLTWNGCIEWLICLPQAPIEVIRFNVDIEKMF